MLLPPDVAVEFNFIISFRSAHFSLLHALCTLQPSVRVSLKRGGGEGNGCSLLSSPSGIGFDRNRSVGSCRDDGGCSIVVAVLCVPTRVEDQPVRIDSYTFV